MRHIPDRDCCCAQRPRSITAAPDGGGGASSRFTLAVVLVVLTALAAFGCKSGEAGAVAGESTPADEASEEKGSSEESGESGASNTAGAQGADERAPDDDSAGSGDNGRRGDEAENDGDGNTDDTEVSDDAPADAGAKAADEGSAAADADGATATTETDGAWTGENVTPLPEDKKKIFFGSPEDEKPEERERAAHYWAGNEAFLYVFEQDIRGLHGGYMGVGSDQNYIFIGWQRPEVAWLTDYDHVIQDVHRIHRAFFYESETPDDFLALWKDAERGAAVIRATYPDDPVLEDMLEYHERAQPYISRRLHTVREEFDEVDVSFYLNDQDDYDYIVEMWKAERIRPLLGNLLADKALIGIGDAARELGIPLRVVYMSNAEQYWDYPDQFRENFAKMHFDDRSIIVRTLAQGRKNDDYKFNVQPAHNFNEWLAESWIKNVWRLKRDWEERYGREFSYSTITVAEYLEKRRKRKAREKARKKE